MKRDLLCRAGPGIEFTSAGGVHGFLRVVPSYTHLGTVISHNGSEEPNLQHRAALLRQLFKPLRSRLLYNRWLTQQEKVRLISERVLLRFLYGAGFWAPRTVAERELTLGPIRTTYRQSFRPITGTSSAGFSNQEVASFLGLPTAEELLHQARAAAFTEVCDTGSAAVHALLRRDGTWLGLAWDSFRTVLGEHVPVGLCTSDPPALAELLALLPGGADQARQLCKRYLKAQCANRAPPPPLAARDAAASEMPKIVEVSHPQLQHVCQTCCAAFLSLRRLSVHRARKHQERAIGCKLAWGSQCERCGVEFWHTTRLAQHLQRSLPCRRVYDHSDTQPTTAQVSGRTAVAWRPATRVAGPRPFWATLSPGDGHAA